MKQKLTLFDQFMSAHSWQKHTIASGGLRAATKFVLDSQASAFIGDLIRKVGMEMLAQHEFARTPYPITWVELDHLSYWRALTHTEPDDRADEQWGMFINNNIAHVITNAVHDKTPIILPMRFHLHTRISYEEELAISQKVGMSRLMFRKNLVGTLGGGTRPEFDDLVDELGYSHKAEIMESWLSSKEVKPEHWNEFISSSSGDLKLILALLLLLTRPGREVLRITEQPRRVGLSRGKRKVFLEHSTVQLRLEERDPIKRVIGGLTTGVERRRHPVRGHWCQSRKVGRGCEHKWVALDEDHYECSRGCGARRWWRENCWRGKFNEGFVSREGYEVHR